jgi:hypothetical protein
MGTAMIIGGLAAMALGLAMFIWAARFSSPPAILRRRLLKAGLGECRLKKHPRPDAAFASCPDPDAAAQACAALAGSARVAAVRVVGGERRTVEVTYA